MSAIHTKRDEKGGLITTFTARFLTESHLRDAAAMYRRDTSVPGARWIWSMCPKDGYSAGFLRSALNVLPQLHREHGLWELEVRDTDTPMSYLIASTVAVCLRLSRGGVQVYYVKDLTRAGLSA